MNHLRQILFVAPSLYLHNWETRKGKWEMMIQIPANIERLLQLDDQKIKIQQSEQAHSLPVNSSIMRARVTFLRTQLLKRVYSDYEKFKMNNAHLMQNSSHDYDIFVTQRWPGIFNLNNVKLVSEVPYGQIKEQP